MSLASPRGLPRSPRTNESVLKAEMKLNREEAARLQESSARIEVELKEMRGQLKQLKLQAKAESERRKQAIEAEETKHEEAMREKAREFDARESEIASARQSILKQFHDAASQGVYSLKAICGDVKETMRSESRTAPAALADVRALTRTKPAVKLGVSEGVAFEVANEEEPTTWYTPLCVLDTIAWIERCLE